jgi:quinol monooxygenase YgiN
MMETTDIKKIQNITKDSIRLLAFFEPKKGRGQELEKILLELVELTRKE